MADAKDELLTRYLFPIVRRPQIPDPYAGERVVHEAGVCMRLGCGDPRWVDPEKGETVLCKFHVEEVQAGEAKAPPLRTVIDYQAVGRKTFLVEHLPEPEEPKK